eukprot:gene18652-25168_t
MAHIRFDVDDAFEGDDIPRRGGSSPTARGSAQPARGSAPTKNAKTTKSAGLFTSFSTESDKKTFATEESSSITEVQREQQQHGIDDTRPSAPRLIRARQRLNSRFNPPGVTFDEGQLHPSKRSPGTGKVSRIEEEGDESRGPSRNVSKAYSRATAMSTAMSNFQDPAETGVESVADRLPRWKLAVLRVMSNRWFYTLMVILTFYIIFEDDIKRAALPPTWDLPLESIIAAIFIFFVTEMTLSSLVKPGYFLGFYFWMDVIVCTSLFFEIPTIRASVMGEFDDYPCLDTQDDFITFVGDRAFIGSKAVRVARIFRLLRLLRLFQLYKEINTRRRIREVFHQAGTPHVQERVMTMIELEIMQDQNKETRVGQRLEELTIRRVIIYVLLMVVFLPAFDLEYGIYGIYIGTDRGGLKMLHDMSVVTGGVTTELTNASVADESFYAALDAFLITSTYKVGPKMTSGIYYLHIHNTTLQPQPEDSPRRYDELYYMSYITHTPFDCGTNHEGKLLHEQLSPPPSAVPALPPPPPGECSRWYSVAVYDWKWYSQLQVGPQVVPQAILNILRSLFLICLFALGSYFLNRDSRHLVIEPIERMLRRLQEIADNPLAHMSVSGTPVTWKERLDAKKEAMGEVVNAEPVKAPPASFGSRKDGSGGGSMTKASVSRSVGHGSLRRQGTGGAEEVVEKGFWGKLKDKLSKGFKLALTHVWDGDPKENDGTNGKDNGYETQVLESSVQKIGALLAVGYGDAGAEIIAENIRMDGDINPMVPGKKMVAVFGFCDVRKFTDTTEVLQEEVMEFVNSIAHIVWKLPEGFDLRDVNILRTQNNMIPSGSYPTKSTGVSDLSIRAGPVMESFETPMLPWTNSLAAEPSQAWPDSPTKPRLPKWVSMDSAGRSQGSRSLSKNTSPRSNTHSTAPGPVAESSVPSAPYSAIFSEGGISREEEEEYLREEVGGNLNDTLQSLHENQESIKPERFVRITPSLLSGPPRGLPISSQVGSSQDSTSGHSSESYIPATSGSSLPGCVHSDDKGPSDPALDASDGNAMWQVKSASAAPVMSHVPPELDHLNLNDTATVTSVQTRRPVTASDPGLPSNIARKLEKSLTPPRSSTLANYVIGEGQLELPGIPGADKNHASLGGGAVALVAENSAQGSKTLKNSRSMFGSNNKVVPVVNASSRMITDLLASSTKGTPADLKKLGLMQGKEAYSDLEKQELIQLIGDNALASFVVIHAAVKRSTRLWRYTQRADIMKAMPGYEVAMGFGLHIGWAIEGAIGGLWDWVGLGVLVGVWDLMGVLVGLTIKAMPGYEVAMGFGLHIGWAIEGAIGSEYKIDASYLSPNVNMAARLEAATKQFGVSLLLSEDFVYCLSPGVRQKVRQIDCVTVKGSSVPMGLFTYDISLDRIPEPVDPSHPSSMELQGEKKAKAIATTDAEAEAAEEELLWAQYYDEWNENPDLLQTWGIDIEFKNEFEEGFQAYKTGNWQHARDVLEGCLMARTDLQDRPIKDVPSEVLLTYMGGFNFVAPPTWRGFRELTEK